MASDPMPPAELELFKAMVALHLDVAPEVAKDVAFKVRAVLDPMRARLAEAERLLLAVEWAIHIVALADGSVAPCCPCCNCYQMHGHAPDCALARWLEGGGR